MNPLLSIRKGIFLGGIAILCNQIPIHAAEQTTEKDFKKVHELFANPPKSFRSAPLWVWNADVTRADIDRMLKELKEQGFGGAFVHPRPGLITEYLSPEWFELYKYSVEQGKAMGLDIWIYDENSYPSGFAGGHVPDQMPESYNQGQGLNLTKTNILPENIKDYALCLKRTGETFKDITANINEYRGKEGEYYLFNKTYYGKSDWNAGYSYVDLLYPGVTEKFIDITMQGYEKTFGKELGTIIKGIFTDEPNIATPGGIRWTPDLFSMFYQQWGYDLKEKLPLLVEEIGNWQEVRHNYEETLTQMFIDRWAKPYHDYCEKMNMKWTGHYWEHGWPDVGHGGDNMAMYAWHQMPAIDMLFNQYNENHPQAQFGNVRAVKELRSAANQMGYTRTLSETYGGGGWDETFMDLKRLGDWEYVLGVNFMNQHLAHMTIVGARKYDYPPVFTSLSPWWSSYKTLNDYFARLSLLLSQGEQLNDILVLEPTTSIWMYYSYVRSNEKVMTIGTNFQQFVTELEKNQVEYDLGSENIIKDNGYIKKGKFCVGKRSYGKVVIPPMTENLNDETFTLLKQFVKSGGELITFSHPTRINGKENAELSRFWKENDSRILLCNTLDNETIEASFRNDIISFSNISAENLYHHRRTYNDGELIFLTNSSLTNEAKGELTVKGKSVLILDGIEGKTYTYPFTKEKNKVNISFHLMPAGSLILYCSKSKSSNYPQYKPFKEGIQLQAVGKTEIKRVKDNIQTLDFCDLTINGTTEHNLYNVEACNKLYRHFGMNDPWNSAVQFKKKIIERDTFSTGNIQVTYHFTIGEKFNADQMKLIAEQPSVWTVKINGNMVVADPKEHILDSRFGVYYIGKYVKEGINDVELSVSPMSIFAEIAPAYIAGDFTLEPTPTGWVIKKPQTNLNTGSWKKQGMPFYPWEMSYTKTYEITDTDKDYTVQLHQWKSTVTEVYVNDEKAGIIAFPPYNLNISEKLKQGMNKIEVRVVGALDNLFGPHHRRDQGIMGPWHWNGVGNVIPASEYVLSDYGLFEDFTLMKAE